MITIRFFAAAREAAGASELESAPGSLQEILNNLENGNLRLASVFSRSSFLIDGVVAHDLTVQLLPGSTVDVLPPFAGG